MMQLSLLRNYWALLSIYGNLIYTTKAQCYGTKMAPYFNDLKDEESFERRTGKLSARFLFFFATLNNNDNKRHCSKANDDCLLLKSAVNYKQQDILFS